MSISHKPEVWAPADDGTMLRVDPNAPLYVRLTDFIETAEQFEHELRIARANEADARRSAMEASQREARWMMIEQRVRGYLRTHGGDTEGCTCPSCTVKAQVLQFLNSDPPVGDGFQTQRGIGVGAESDVENG